MLDVLTIKLCLLSKPGTPEVACSDEFVCERYKDNTNFEILVTIYNFTPNRISEWIHVVSGRDARGKAAFANSTRPEDRNVLRLQYIVRVKWYLIAPIFIPANFY